MSERYLLVGGPADGARHVTNGAAVFQIATRAESGKFAAHRYEAQAFVEGEQRHLVYFHSSIPPGAYLAALIGGYRA